MKTFTVEAPVDCRGVYTVQAEDAEAAKRKVAEWNGDDEVAFSHYSDEVLSTDPTEMQAEEDP